MYYVSTRTFHHLPLQEETMGFFNQPVAYCFFMKIIIVMYTSFLEFL